MKEMRVLKPIIFVTAVSILFLSCKSSIVTIPVPKGSETVINIPAKKADLTEKEFKTWSHLDLQTDSIPGMSVENAYKFLEGKNGVSVIVAVADSGIDVEHEDLKEVAWKNPKEIPENKKDDDKNGYKDDVNGWNFLGSKDGRIVNADQLEITRIVKRGMDKFGDKKESEISGANKTEFKKFLELKEKYNKSLEAHKQELENLQKTEDRILEIEQSFKDVRKFIGKESFTVQDLKSTKPASPQMAAKIADISNLLSRGMTEEGLLEYKTQLLEYKKPKDAAKSYDLDFNARQSMGDNLYDITDTDYGNNNVIGSKDLESHGTHVAGIIAAVRENGKGVNGVAKNVKIMAVRVVPDGDEHDKDVALGIRYAVDNGAKIINTSFGKAYSPNKEWVYDAIKYAAKKDVLIVNAAGNDGKNIDIEKSFPNDSNDLVNEISDNFITIGAISHNYNKELVASFSNYGKMNVDVFAPGVNIYSTFPKDEYEAISGTSMASPSAAGIAALVRSYYPQLSASQVKHILMNSGTKINLDVIKPGSKSKEKPQGELVPFSDLSVSGRIVNAFNALQMADKIVNSKK